MVEEKQKKVEYMKNYYLAYKKPFLRFYNIVGNWGFLGQILRFQKNILTYEKIIFYAILGQNSKNISTNKKWFFRPS